MIEELNAILEKEKSLYKVNLIKDTDVGNLLHILPAQLVVYKTTDEVVNGLYDAEFGYGTY